MPANLPPQYFEVEKKYRESKNLHEKLGYLQDLLAIIPKHKGTEKLQADLKTKISKLKESISKQKKSGGTGGAWYQVEKQGAGQVVLVGLANSGRSTLLNTLTNAHVEVALYPFTTNLPQIGMMEYEDIKIQIVDTPPMYEEAPAWLFGLYRNGDMVVLVLDAQSDMEKDFETVIGMLEERNIHTKHIESGDVKKTIILLNKSDEGRSVATDEFIAKHEGKFQIVLASPKTGAGIDELKKQIFIALGVIRVYTKKIGHPIERKDPVVMGAGATVMDAAEHIHKDFRKNLRFARLWNDSNYSGQRVEKGHVLADGDLLEFHV
ncbi:MAG: 50S ribosome-binding GTPase [candidate division WOR-3 bacterium]|nr:MAG: 50S ribosome-binding GTPase [candidate division WOR-3 bacterium]